MTIWRPEGPHPPALTANAQLAAAGTGEAARVRLLGGGERGQRIGDVLVGQLDDRDVAVQGREAIDDDDAALRAHSWAA